MPPPVRSNQQVSSLPSELKKLHVRKPAPKIPLWDGPEKEGITFSMISRWLTCRERFRVTTVEGWKPNPVFTPVLEYGQMWHACEEATAGNNDWYIALHGYFRQLLQKYPTDRPQIENWYNICQVQYPAYLNFWATNDDVVNRVPLYQEKTFDVPYPLPSGRTVRLRGKIDSADTILDHNPGNYVQENKTKSRIDVVALNRQLKFDLQTNIYLVAMDILRRTEEDPAKRGQLEKYPLRGVRYNVVKRPSQYQGKKETPQGFAQRLSEIINENPGEFFARWKVEVSYGDVGRFETRTLIPILENICDDYEWWKFCAETILDVPPDKSNRVSPYDGEDRDKLFPRHCPRHYQHPFGVRNIMDEGGATDLDEYLMTGSTVGLYRSEKLFEEL